MSEESENRMVERWLGLVTRDFAETTGGRRLRFELASVDDDALTKVFGELTTQTKKFANEGYCMCTVFLDDEPLGTFIDNVSLGESDVIEVMAGHAKDLVFDRIGIWRECPVHGTELIPDVVEDQVVWSCQTASHVVGPVGSLGGSSDRPAP